MVRNANTARADVPRTAGPTLVHTNGTRRTEEGDFFRGLLVAIPIAGAMWLVIIWGVIHLMRTLGT